MFSDRTSCLGGALVVVLEVDVDDVVVVELDSRLQGLNLCGKLLLYDCRSSRRNLLWNSGTWKDFVAFECGGKEAVVVSEQRS